MSIATRTGDLGQTSLMFSKKVSKDDPRVHAYGSVDELNAALGLARATAKQDWIREEIRLIQQDMVGLMGELALMDEDRRLYTQKGYSCIEESMLKRLDDGIEKIENKRGKSEGWIMSGDTLESASLDLARTACRRAERHIVHLVDHHISTIRPIILQYINRLSDFLWLLSLENESS